MSKKEKIIIRRDDDLVDIDDELDQAMQLLDGANQRIVDLLATMEPVKPMPEMEGAEGGGEATAQATSEEAPQSPNAT